ncbi:MAG: SGNH/GDSL hydrolase family protein [Burkholderiales bacterium]|nr:SGNH/GDSL hydrolase family protein [Burkholderiales bacterium]
MSVRGTLGHHLALGALAPLLPVMLWQGRRVRRTTPRLPDAAGADRGVAGTGARRVAIAVVGESTVSGVGARTHATGWPGRLAESLARATDARVAWRAVGVNGAAAARVARVAAETLAGGRCDAAFVALGVNDVLEFTRVARWRADVASLCDFLAGACGARLVVLAGVPPLERFPALPQPLAAFLGTRARALDAALADLARRRGDAVHVPFAIAGGAAMFCADRFHPSERGYARWAAHTVAAALPALTARGVPGA